ncbi:MAG: protein kinase [Alphaproteobacteria bacterium]|nr:protein kinase [Alphaproteobacteria bacterium]
MPQAPLQPNDRFGRYEILRRLGVGGTGEVWQAWLVGPEGFRKPVALKVLRGDPELDRGSLIREARLGGMLQHPNIVGIHDLGEVDGRWYVAMELCDGVSLARLLRERGPLPPLAIVEVGLQVCAGLAHLHGQRAGDAGGMVHRDIKPSNLLLDRSGLVKIADLGVARLQATRDAPAGTAGYMPEEQVDGRENAKADLFALGATLAHLATGVPPFGTGAPALFRVLEADRHVAEGLLDPVEQAVPGLGELVARCLRQAPSERWSSAAALRQALAELRPRHAESRSLLDLLEGSSSDTFDGPITPSAPSVGSLDRTLDPFGGNLEPDRSSFVGRVRELDALAALLRDQRLVVLKGPGGSGKTRLALRAAQLAGRFAERWFVDLSDARDADAVTARTAAALSIPMVGTDPTEQVGQALRARGAVLVVLDNLEQVVHALPETLGRWLATAPSATFLCTTRVSLRLRGEQQLEVEPLDHADALALFAARAHGVPVDDGVLGALVDALERMPLALELAAARTRLLPPPVLLERLRDRLDLLAGGERDRPERQRSLAASLAVSWGLLPAWGRAAMVQLSVFEGGAALEMAEQVLDLADHEEAPWAIDVLATLVDASVLRLDPTHQRFRMSVVVQEWVRRQATPGALDAAVRRHGEVFAALGSPDRLRLLRTIDAPRHHDRYHLEVANLMAATRAAVDQGRSEIAVSCATAAAAVLTRRGPARVLVELWDRVLAGELTDEQRLLALEGAVIACGLARERARRRTLLDEAIPLGERLGDRSRVCRLAGQRAVTLAQQGHGEEAEKEALRAVEMARGIDDPLLAGRVATLAGTVAWLTGAHALARERFEESAAANRRMGDHYGVASDISNIALIDLYLHESERALEGFARARRLFGNEPTIHVTALWMNEAITLVDLGRPREAIAPLEQAAQWKADFGLDESRALTLTNLGIALVELARFEQAEHVAGEALRLAPNGVAVLHQARLVQARIARARGATTEAMRLTRGVHDERRDDEDRRTSAHLMAELLVEHGDPAAAIQWTEVVALASEGDPVRECSARILAAWVRSRAGVAVDVADLGSAWRSLARIPGMGRDDAGLQAAELFAGSGAVEQARALAGEIAARAEDAGCLVRAAEGWRVVALASGGPEARRALDHAEELVRGAGLPPGHPIRARLAAVRQAQGAGA